MPKPELVLSLNAQRKIVHGSTRLLNRKLAGGADLRISTGFRHNEHIDPASPDDQLVNETSTFAETVLIDGKWSAGFMTLRQPVQLLRGFGEANALSLFVYNQDGSQGLARLGLDGTIDRTVRRDFEEDAGAKTRTFAIHDEKTAGVSTSFIYEFENFDFFVTDSYRELYAHDRNGRRTNGRLGDLERAYRRGRGIKLAVKGLSEVLWGDTGHVDEIFLHCGSSYHYTESRMMITSSLPFVSVPADIPLAYKPRSFLYCWIVARSDGHLEVRTFDVFKRRWKTRSARLPLRWFAQI